MSRRRSFVADFWISGSFGRRFCIIIECEYTMCLDTPFIFSGPPVFDDSLPPVSTRLTRLRPSVVLSSDSQMTSLKLSSSTTTVMPSMSVPPLFSRNNLLRASNASRPSHRSALLFPRSRRTSTTPTYSSAHPFSASTTSCSSRPKPTPGLVASLIFPSFPSSLSSSLFWVLRSSPPYLPLYAPSLLLPVLPPACWLARRDASEKDTSATPWFSLPFSLLPPFHPRPPPFHPPCLDSSATNVLRLPVPANYLCRKRPPGRNQSGPVRLLPPAAQAREGRRDVCDDRDAEAEKGV